MSSKDQNSSQTLRIQFKYHTQNQDHNQIYHGPKYINYQKQNDKFKSP